jgi:hypothetical protein
MANLTVQTTPFTGLNYTSVSADVAGDSFANDGRTFLLFKNANAASRTLTIAANDTTKPGFGTIATPDTTVTIPGSGTNGGLCIVGPFPTERFNNPTTGKVDLAYSAVTDLTVSAVKLSVYP